MTIQTQSRFKNTPDNVSEIISKLVENKEPIVSIRSSNIPEKNPAILKSRGKNRENRLPDEYKTAIAEIENHVGMSSELTYSGKVWILIGEKADNSIESINVGQTTNIYNEISKIVWDILIKHEGAYYDEIQNYKCFSFYEVDVDAVLSDFIKKNVPDAMNSLPYEMVKDYYAEVLVAYSTSAKNWNCSFGGIDSRFINWLNKEYDNKYEFDRSRGGN